MTNADIICDFIEKSSGLEMDLSRKGYILIHQRTDGKTLSICFEDIEDVIKRTDSDGQGFLQVNFCNGQKILLTEKLVGFKPARHSGLDMDKLPKVVTTPDLISVVEAIEESLNSEEPHPAEIEVLRKVFDAVLEGGEAVGFNLSFERDWVRRLSIHKYQASA